MQEARAKASRLPSATASTQARKFAMNTVLKEEPCRRGAVASSPPIALARQRARSFSSGIQVGCPGALPALLSPSHAWHREQSHGRAKTASGISRPWQYQQVSSKDRRYSE